MCRCFYCCSVFPADAVQDWCDEDATQPTALGPRCGIDSVIGDKSGYDISPAFLSRMKAYWF